MFWVYLFVIMSRRYLPFFNKDKQAWDKVCGREPWSNDSSSSYNSDAISSQNTKTQRNLARKPSGPGLLPVCSEVTAILSSAIVIGFSYSFAKFWSKTGMFSLSQKSSSSVIVGLTSNV